MHDDLQPTDDDVAGHRLASNDNEVVVGRPAPSPNAEVDDADVEGHRLATNDNEIVVGPDARQTGGAAAG